MPVEGVEQNLLLLAQARELLPNLTDDDYRGAAGPGGEGTTGLGPHFRHCVDFYRCFLRDLAAGRIDYDRRERDSRLESERSVALAALDEIESGLARIDLDPGHALEVRVDVGPGEDGDWSRSSVGRELSFLVSHTIHHYALIAQQLRGRGIEPGAGFGVAPSTLAHWSDAGRQ